MKDQQLKEIILLKERMVLKKKRLEEQLDSVNQQLNKINEIIEIQKHLEKIQSENKDSLTIKNDTCSIETPYRNISRLKKRPKNPPKEIIADAVRDILIKNAHPMSRKELFDEIQNLGFNIQGAHPEMVFSTMLWRMPEKVIRLNREYGYWLPERDWEPAGYRAPKKKNDDSDFPLR